MIQASSLFSALSTLTMLSWVALILAPKSKPTRLLVRSFLIPGILSAFYALVILFKFSQLEGGFGKLEDVQKLLSQPWGATVGWIHYLAFDLFVGIWIVARAEANKVSHVFVAPLLFATFMLGPIGFLGYLAAEKVFFASAPFHLYVKEKWKLWNSKNAFLTQTACLLFVLAALCLAATLFDKREVDGAPIWFKPAKFFASLGIYQLTIAWFLGTLKGSLSRTYVQRFQYWTFTVAVVEMTIICGQAFLGVRSHYNVSSPLAQVLYGVMGLFIVANSFVVAHLAWRWIQSRKKIAYPLWLGGMYGLGIFLFTCVLATAMSSQPFSRMGIDVPALAAPWVGWSGSAGDLRISHFVGLHALQLFPLFGWFVHRQKQTTLTLSLAAGFTALLVLGLFLLAFSGYPILAV